jgi:hypothetical protein
LHHDITVTDHVGNIPLINHQTRKQDVKRRAKEPSSEIWPASVPRSAADASVPAAGDQASRNFALTAGAIERPVYDLAP